MRTAAVSLFIAVMPTCAGAADAAPAFGPQAWAAGDTLTGDWGGLRSQLAQLGITIEVNLVTDAAILSRDGADGDRRYTERQLNLGAHVDLGSIIGLTGGTLFAGFQSIAGDDGSAQAGVLQPYASIDAAHRDQLAQLWYDQLLWEGTVDVRIGKQDASDQFARGAQAAAFVNGAFSYPPAIVGLPAYPDPATGLVVALRPGGYYAKGGLFDGRSAVGIPTGDRWLHVPTHDVFSIAEVGLSWDTWNRDHLGGVGVGMWRHSAAFTRFDGSTSDGTRGTYAVADGMLWAAPGGRGGGISGFVEAGMADKQVTRYARHLAVGVTSAAPSQTTAGDVIGLAGTWVGTSREPGSPCDADELTIEVFYAWQAAGWLTLKPDVQWIRHPGGIAAAHDLFVGLLRAKVVF